MGRDRRSEGSPFIRSVREAIRVRHLSLRTEDAYVAWVKRFILFHAKRHPGEMREAEVAAFLTHLAVERDVAPATQNQALNVLNFLYKCVLQRPLARIGGVVRAQGKQRLPVVLTPQEMASVLAELRGRHWLIACLLYGSGLRLMETVCLRVKDLDCPPCNLYTRRQGRQRSGSDTCRRAHRAATSAFGDAPYDLRAR